MPNLLDSLFPYDPESTEVYVLLRELSDGTASYGCQVIENERYVVAFLWEKSAMTARAKTCRFEHYEIVKLTLEELRRAASFTHGAAGIRVCKSGFEPFDPDATANACLLHVRSHSEVASWA